MDSPLLSFGTELWRGGVNAWECDEMGHMNTRFYLARCMEAVAVLFAKAGIPRAVASSLVRPEETHIRFHREAHAANSLHITGGFSRLGDDDADAVFLLHHSLTGVLAASFRMRLQSLDGNGSRQEWPAEFVRLASALQVEVPKEAQARSTGHEPISAAPRDLSAHTRIMLGSLTGTDCGPDGRMLPLKFLGAAADGVRRLTAPLREIVVQHADTPPKNYGGAVLEFRLVHFDWPQLGDCIEIRSAFKGADSRVMRLEHWLLDALDGRPLGYQEVVAIVFDIDQRKIVGITEAAKAELDALVVA